jgi:hypothetical protein
LKDDPVNTGKWLYMNRQLNLSTKLQIIISRTISESVDILSNNSYFISSVSLSSLLIRFMNDSSLSFIFIHFNSFSWLFPAVFHDLGIVNFILHFNYENEWMKFHFTQLHSFHLQNFNSCFHPFHMRLSLIIFNFS